MCEITVDYKQIYAHIQLDMVTLLINLILLTVKILKKV